MTDQEALIVLNAIDGLGNIRIKRLCEHFGSPSKIFTLKENDLLEARIVAPVAHEEWSATVEQRPQRIEPDIAQLGDVARVVLGFVKDVTVDLGEQRFVRQALGRRRLVVARANDELLVQIPLVGPSKRWSKFVVTAYLCGVSVWI